jgi:hypothetical protein
VDDGGNDSGGRRERLMKNKNGKGADFFPILALDFLTLNAWNSSLFIGGGRETLFFFFFIWDIYWPLIQLIRISTVGSKVQS